MSTLLVLTNLPDRAAAERLAGALIEQRVAACVNILSPCRSVYRWKGAVQREEEHPVLIKTTAERYAALEAAIRAGASLRTSRNHRGPNRARPARLPRLGGRRDQNLR